MTDGIAQRSAPVRFDWGHRQDLDRFSIGFAHGIFRACAKGDGLKTQDVSFGACDGGHF